MDAAEKHQQRELAEETADEKRSLEDEVLTLTETLRRWRYSVLYLVVAVTVAVALQIHQVLQ